MSVTKSSHLELAVGARDANHRLVANHLSGNHGQGLALGGVDLSWHDTAARLILWQAQLSQAASGTRAQVPDIVSDLHERARNDIEGTMCLNKSVMRRKRLELVWCRLEVKASNLGDLGCYLHIETLPGVKTLIALVSVTARRFNTKMLLTVPTAVPP